MAPGWERGHGSAAAVKADAAAVKHEEDYLGQGQYSVVTHCSRAGSADQCVASSSRRRLEYEEAAVGSCAKKIGSAASVSAGGSRKMARVGEAEEARASPCRWRKQLAMRSDAGCE
ncbi:hypothetical protein B296_00018581 [Ensete ventricosum]|uniref:Uncharacterized protein n=1 Tax=Ensete ventricosum TaxID=4639 RepID=A0A427ACQ1_ENSVE|nr:hypothetical protein B296_00018581 [Ensete ventricosum]